MVERVQTQVARGPKAAPGRELGRAVAIGCEVALIGSVLLATLEYAAAEWLVPGGGAERVLPLALVLAGLGKAVLTHLLLWSPATVVVAVAHRALLRKREVAHSIAVTASLFGAGVAVVVVPAGLELAGQRGAGIEAASVAGGLLLAAGLYVALRALENRLSRESSRRFLHGAALVAATGSLVPVFYFVGSPLANPSGYRVPLPLPPATAAAGASPNVIWIVLDTVRADRLSVYGYERPTTPFLEEWGAHSIVFERAISNGMWTVPSHASMFTGLSIREHGTSVRNTRLDEALPTVAEILHERGYETASFSNNPWVALQRTHLLRGFEKVELMDFLRRRMRVSLEYVRERWGITPFLPWLDTDYGAALTNHRIAEWLKHRTDSQKPFFLFVNYMEAHLPTRVPIAYRERFMDEAQVQRSYDLPEFIHPELGLQLATRFNVEDPDFLAEPDREILRRQYDAAICYLDERVREVLALLEARGLLENSLVVINADHGEHLGSHDMWSHVFGLYEDLIHVPLLVREPGRERGVRIRTPVQLSDLFGTILRATGARDRTADRFGARDLIELAGRKPEDRTVVSEFNGARKSVRLRVPSERSEELKHRIQPQRAATDSRFKLTLGADGYQELFDLTRDPSEERNLLPEEPAEAARLRAYLDLWQQRVPAHPAQDGTADASDDEMDTATREALRALGYLIDDDEP